MKRISNGNRGGSDGRSSWWLSYWWLLWTFFFTVVRSQQAPNPALEIPLFQVPGQENEDDTTTNPFSTALPGTFRNDFCPLSYQVTVAQTLALGDALRGMDIHVALMQGDFVKFDQNDLVGNDDDHHQQQNLTLNANYPGLVPRLLDDLCQRAGCTWRNTYAAPSYADLARTNATFLDLLVWSINVYDIMAEWWMRSVQRLQAGATFTEPWYDGTIIMVAPRLDEESDQFDPWGWLAPFDRGVWIMVVATVLASSLIYWLLWFVWNPSHSGHGNNDDDVKHFNFLESLWLFGTAFVGQFEFGQPPTGPALLFTFSIAFWALLMTSAYTANLASFLVIRNTPATRIESLAQAVNMQKRLCVWKSSGTDVAVTSAFPTFAASGRLVRTLTPISVFQGVRDGDCDIAITEVSTWDVFQTNSSINGDCTLTWIGRPYQTVPASFAVKGDAGTLCTSLLRDVFNLYLHDMEMDGTIEELWNEHIDNQATVTCTADESEAVGDRRRRRLEQQGPAVSHRRQLKTATKNAANKAGNDLQDDPETTKLTLTNMGGIFMLHGVLSAIAVLCAVIPWFWRRWHVSHKSPTTVNNKIRTPSITSKLPDDGSSCLSAKSGLFYFDAVAPKDSMPDSHVVVGGSADVDLLRAELQFKLGRIEEKLSALLDKQ